MSSPALDADFQIATFAAGTGALATLFSLGVTNPHPVWRPSVTSVKLGNNAARQLGAPAVLWMWGFVSQRERDVLRTFCPGASAQVYLITPTSETVGSVPNASKTYLAQMIWPSPDRPEDPFAGRRIQFEILFRQLIPV
jgi:hypothetical protein